MTNDKTYIRNNVKNIRDLGEYELICSEFKQIIVIYNNNYKCLKCKCFICNKCKKNHMENCKFCSFINLYDIGYICEGHKKKNIDSCEMCNIYIFM